MLHPLKWLEMAATPLNPLPRVSSFRARAFSSQWHPHYEFRPGQLEMAEGVEEAPRRPAHLLVDAGTGTERRSLIWYQRFLQENASWFPTGTKNLQEQLFYKDIPFPASNISRAIAGVLHEGPR